MSCTAVLEPNLNNSSAEPCHFSQFLQSLGIRIIILSKLCLHYLQLFRCEGGACPLGWFRLAILVRGQGSLQCQTCAIFSSAAQIIQHGIIVITAKHSALYQPKLLTSGQLPFTGETGEAGQVVHTTSGSSHPVTGIHLPTALCTLCAKPTKVVQFAEDFFVFDVTAAVLPQRRSAHGALQAAQVPVQVVHLKQVAVVDVHAAARTLVLVRRRGAETCGL